MKTLLLLKLLRKLIINPYGNLSKLPYMVKLRKQAETELIPILLNLGINYKKYICQSKDSVVMLSNIDNLISECQKRLLNNE